jgi:type I restriction enzyme S subunit
MREARLGDVVASMKNGMNKHASEYANDGMPCLRMYNIDAGSIVWRDIKRMKVTPQEYADYGLHEGDLLVNRVNSRELVGKAAVIPASLEPSVFESKNIRVRLDTSKALPKFINYQLFARGSKHFANNAQQVVGMASISQGQLSDFPIVLTGIDEQREIVAELEKQFSRLDEAVANLQRVKANLKRYKASVLKAAVEGRLVEIEASLARREGRTFESGEQLLERILEERRAKCAGKGKYKEPVVPDTACFGALPAGWVWTSGDQLTSVITDGEHITPRRTPEGVLLLSARNVLNGRLALDDVDYVPEDEYERIAKRIAIQAGDVLLSCSGTVGRSCVVPTGLRFTLVRSVAVLRPVIMLADFMTYNLQSPLGQSQIDDRKTQTAQANLFQGKIRQLVFALPPLAEQARIVAEVDRHLSIIREVEAEVDANLQRAQALRQATLAKAFEVRS